MLKIEDILTKFNRALLSMEFYNPIQAKLGEFEREIQDAHNYPLQSGGKRIRPLLALLSALAIGGETALKTAMPSALALELVHTYTLVHDDLPCMDNDDLRRGRATTHKVFGEAKALLVGDGLLAHAFLLLTKTNWQEGLEYTKEIFESLAKATCPNGVIWGQWLDISCTGLESTDWETMETVHMYKTGILIAASLEMGFLCGLSQSNINKNKDDINKIRLKIQKAGILIGLAFQIIDDILDATQSSQVLGKTSGKDESQNKYTAIKLLGEKKAQELAKSYTVQSLELLNEIFTECKNENNNYQKLTINFVENLLNRLN